MASCHSFLLLVICLAIFASHTRYFTDIFLPFSSVIGLSDGLTVPFALTAGLSSLGESNIVVLGGVAELIAGAISMGVGGFRTFNHNLYSQIYYL